jgi:hypothetical protein
MFVFVTPLFAEDKKSVVKEADSQKTEVKEVEKKESDQKDSEGIKTFEEKGIFSVEVPEKVLKFKNLHDKRTGKDIDGVYLFWNKKSPSTANLSYFKQNLKTDYDKRNFIEEHFKSFKHDFEKGDNKILEGEMPKLESKIPDRISYSLKLQNPEKSEFFQYTTIFFGKNTFSINTQSRKLDEAKALNEKIVKSFKELEKDK